MSYNSVRKISTSYGQKSLADFVAKLRAKPGPRGTVITIIREILEETDAPVAWSDLARVLAHRSADHLIMPARVLWSEFRKSASVSPGSLAKGRQQR